MSNPEKHTTKVPEDTPVLSIVGRSKSGKTTVIETIIRQFKRSGLRIAIIKHHSCPGFEIDIPGKDTWRHARAGADTVIITAPDKIALIQKKEYEPGLDEIISLIHNVDLILTNGCLRANKPEIEGLHAAVHRTPLCQPNQVLAYISDFKMKTSNPVFCLNDPQVLAEFIRIHFKQHILQ